MRAAVYRGNGTVEVREVPVPEIGAGRIAACAWRLAASATRTSRKWSTTCCRRRVSSVTRPPVSSSRPATGANGFAVGDRVIAFHHIPCGNCFYCAQKSCPRSAPAYKKVGVTAGFEPAGGGFSQYVRVMDWIVRSGVEKFDDRSAVRFARAWWNR